jgi:hypothetical protein
VVDLNLPVSLSSGLFSLLDRLKDVEKPPIKKGFMLFNLFVDTFKSKGI